MKKDVIPVVSDERYEIVEVFIFVDSVIFFVGILSPTCDDPVVLNFRLERHAKGEVANEVR